MNPVPVPWMLGGSLFMAVASACGAGVLGYRFADANWRATVAEQRVQAFKSQEATRLELARISGRYEEVRQAGDQRHVERQSTIREIYRDRPVPPAACVPEPPAVSVLASAVAAANRAAGGQPTDPLSDPVGAP